MAKNDQKWPQNDQKWPECMENDFWNHRYWNSAPLMVRERPSRLQGTWESNVELGRIARLSPVPPFCSYQFFGSFKISKDICPWLMSYQVKKTPLIFCLQFSDLDIKGTWESNVEVGKIARLSPVCVLSSLPRPGSRDVDCVGTRERPPPDGKQQCVTPLLSGCWCPCYHRRIQWLCQKYPKKGWDLDMVHSEWKSRLIFLTAQKCFFHYSFSILD